MIQGAFRAEDRSQAIGAWSGLGGIAAALGPAGGGPADRPRVVALDLPHQPAARGPDRLAGAALGARDPRSPRPRPLRRRRRGPRLARRSRASPGRSPTPAGPRRSGPPGSGVVAAIAFLVVERRVRVPMVPLGLFADRTFSAANAMTLLVYAALGAILFFLVLQLQTVGGYNALEAGSRDAADHALHARAGRPGRGAGRAHRAADPDDGRPDRDGGRHPVAARRRPRRDLVARRRPGPHGLRPRAGADGRAADRDGARRRSRRRRRHRQRHQQRCRPRGVAARGRRAPDGRRAWPATTTATRCSSTRRTRPR